MALGMGGSGRRDAPLRVLLMAAALVLAAFGGAAIGLVWQSSGLGDDGTDAAADAAVEGGSPSSDDPDSG